MKLRKTRYLQTLVMAVAVVALSTPALAQTDNIGNLQRAIEQNEELLQRAEQLVNETNSTRARASLDSARKLHELSKELYLAGDRPLLTAQTTARARQAILNTINLAKVDARVEEQATKAIERARVRLQQARQAIEEHGNRNDVPAHKLVDEAQNQLERAVNSMHEHLFTIALQLANASTDLSSRAIHMLRRDDITPDLVLREIERTDVVLERLTARPDLHQNPASERAIAEAEDLQNRARHNARGDNYRLAIEQTRRARSIALRVLRAGTGDEETDRVEQSILFTDDIIQRAIDAAAENDDSRARARLGEAVQLQERARDRFNNGDSRAALQLTMQAREIARTALTAMDRPLNEDSVRGTITETDAALDRLRALLGESDNEAARGLYDRAATRQSDARHALESGELRRALAMTRVARNLIRQALTLLEHNGN